MLDLKPLKVSDKIFVLGTPWKGRIILFGFALILGWMTVVNARFPLVPGLLALIAVLAGFYTEQWLFDLEGQVVVHTEGLLFFKRKNSIAFREVVRVELRNSRPGGNAARPDLSATLDPTLEQAPPNRHRGKGFSGLFLILVNGGEVNVHTTSIKKAQEQAKLGRLIDKDSLKPFSSYV